MNDARLASRGSITLKSSVEISASVVLDRPDDDAPVSPLYYRGAQAGPRLREADRQQRRPAQPCPLLASARERRRGRPVWLGSATMDAGVTLSRDTGQVTHRIAPDIDAERDLLIGDLVTAKVVSELYQVSGVGPTMSGRNGEGNPYYTDGDIHIAVLSVGATPVSSAPTTEPDPLLVQGKNQVWAGLESLLAADPEQ